MKKLNSLRREALRITLRADVLNKADQAIANNTNHSIMSESGEFVEVPVARVISSIVSVTLFPVYHDKCSYFTHLTRTIHQSTPFLKDTPRCCA